ncbi:hypothetical protein SDJN03_01697, partial [Cucurbita argyrosperma subsp. sororia]
MELLLPAVGTNRMSYERKERGRVDAGRVFCSNSYSTLLTVESAPSGSDLHLLISATSNSCTFFKAATTGTTMGVKQPTLQFHCTGSKGEITEDHKMTTKAATTLNIARHTTSNCWLILSKMRTEISPDLRGNEQLLVIVFSKTSINARYRHRLVPIPP